MFTINYTVKVPITLFAHILSLTETPLTETPTSFLITRHRPRLSHDKHPWTHPSPSPPGSVQRQLKIPLATIRAAFRNSEEGLPVLGKCNGFGLGEIVGRESAFADEEDFPGLGIHGDGFAIVRPALVAELDLPGGKGGGG